jgi:hypothetical protein
LSAVDNFRRGKRHRPQAFGRWHERRGDVLADIQSGDLIAALDEASLSRFHLRAVLAQEWGLHLRLRPVLIGIASTLITKDWDLSSGRLALLNPRCCSPPSFQAGARPSG